MVGTIRAAAALMLTAMVFSGLPAVGAGAAAAPQQRGAGYVPAGDELITGTGDASGYHLFAAAADDGWAWHPLATLLPGGGAEQKWIGQQCLTGDGRTVVAVVGPWDAANSEDGMNRGGYAYAVNAHTGAVRPLASGVSLAYFNPSCGAAGDVTLTTYLGHDQRPTGISVLRAASGQTVASTVIPGEITSAAWAGNRILAARGGQLVDVTGNAVRVLARLPGRVAQIRAAWGGGAHFIAEGASSSGLWHWDGHGAALDGVGPARSLHLFTGRAGHDVVAGATWLAASAGLTSGLPGGAEGVSLDGAMAQVQTVTPAAARAPRPGRISVQRRDAGGPATVVLPSAATAQIIALPARTLTSQVPAAWPRPQRAASAASGPVTSAYSCSVPRNDIFKQVWQPTSDQVRWAVNQAVQGVLLPPYTSQPRPVDSARYTVNDASYKPLATSYPDRDFPPVAGAPAVPPLVMYGILAQESNWAQASWHAVPGRAGNPLIASYYGSSGTQPIDYSSSDCGYGIGQITDGMQLGTGQTLPTDRQVRVAVDYATNVAAAARILQEKWVQLHQLGIRMNDDDPTKVENWYAAIWAYNSGVYQGSGYQGLGWFNNPANMMYPVRHTFLHSGTATTLDDASHPNDWPYQERVFGWMEVPLTGVDGLLDYRGTYDWDTGAGGFLSTPGPTQFCSLAVNNCNPAQVGAGNDPCPAESGACYWKAPVTWTDCTTQCITDTVTNAPNGHSYHTTPGDPEPQVTPAAATCDLSAASPGTGAIVVGDETGFLPGDNPGRLSPNLMGCPQTGTGLIPPASYHATFKIEDALGQDALTSPDSLAALDVHQIGGGLGGHEYFTHTGPVGTVAYEAKGVWQATLPADTARGTVYAVKAFVPDVAASSAHATYEVTSSTAPPGLELSHTAKHTINQGSYANQWASVGYYLCGGPPAGATAGPASCQMTVTLRTTTPGNDPDQGADIGFGAVAFVPVPTGAYVAIGDSYSSGEGLFGPWDEGTNVVHNDVGDKGAGDNGNLCHRAAGAYPRLYAGAKGIPVVQIACSGSDTCDLAGVPDNVTHYSCSDANPSSAGSAFYDEPTYQTELLRALAPRLVTVTIGGNDIGFANIIATCLQDALPPNFTTCKSTFVTASGDQVDHAIQSLATPLEQALYQVVAAVGDPSKVVLVTYASPINTGWHPLCIDLSQPDRIWLRPKVDELDSVLTTAAHNASLQFNPLGDKQIKVADPRGAFSGHEACSSQPYITAPVGGDLVPTEQGPDILDNFYHPNAAGQAHLEQALAHAVPNP